jgi:hypothetical protein
MDNPMAPLYNGGIIQNSEFNNGLTGWSVPWGVQAVARTSPSGNNFTMSRSNGAKTSRTVFQKIQMQNNNHYALSGTVRLISLRTSSSFFFEFVKIIKNSILHGCTIYMQWL